MESPTPQEPVKEMSMQEAQGYISAKCDEIKNMLLDKNRKYGNSALTPNKTFSKGLTVQQQISVRLDDKIKRLENRQDDEDEDIEKDLTGYLILKMIARDLNL